MHLPVPKSRHNVPLNLLPIHHNQLYPLANVLGILDLDLVDSVPKLPGGLETIPQARGVCFI